MICPKCGNEFEGTNCPRCDAPAILVNASDYERRKREWEEREKLKSREEDRKRRNKEDMQRIAAELANADYKKAISSRAGSLAAFAAKHKKGIIAAAFLLAAVITALVMAVKAEKAANMQIYISDEDSIYKGTSIDNKICGIDENVYNRMNTKAYRLTLPEGIDAESVIASMCSDNGRYFAAVSYEEDAKSDTGSTADSKGIIGESDSTAVHGNALSEGTYTLYAWEKDKACYAAASDKKEKTIQYVSDSGALIYTDTEYMNEGVVKSISLCTSDILKEGAGILYSNDVNEFLLTKDACVWLDSEGKLHACRIDEAGSDVKLAENVKRIYPQVQGSVYSHQNGILQPYKINSFVYADADGKFIRADISNTKKIKEKYLFTINDMVEDVIYEASYESSYAFLRGKLIRYTPALEKDNDKDDGSVSIKEEQLAAAKDFFYIERDKTLYIVNDSGTLIKIAHKKGGIFSYEEILGEVYFGTLNPVMGTQDGFSCVSGDKLYYIQPDKEKIVLKENINQNQMIQAAYHNKNIYYIIQGTLYCVSKDKELPQEIGKAQEIWIGRIIR